MSATLQYELAPLVLYLEPRDQTADWNGFQFFGAAPITLQLDLQRHPKEIDTWWAYAQALVHPGKSPLEWRNAVQLIVLGPNFGLRSKAVIYALELLFPNAKLHPPQEANDPPQAEDPLPHDPADDILIEELDLGVRSYNCLKRAGVQTLGDLNEWTDFKLLGIPNLGKKSAEEIAEALKRVSRQIRKQDLSEIPIDTIASGVDTPTLRMLQGAGITNMDLLTRMSAVELRKALGSGLTDKRVQNIEDALERWNLKLREELEGSMPLEELKNELGGERLTNLLLRAGIQTAGQLTSKSEGELRAIRGLGQYSVDKIVEMLARYGRRLRQG